MLSARRKRHLFLAALAIGGYLVGLPVSRLLDSSRAVVLERRGPKVYVAYLDRMPRWRPLAAAEPGDIVAKPRGAWRVQRVVALASDMVLMQLYARYHAAYEATVVAIEPAEFVGGPSYAVTESADGGHLRVLLAAPHLVNVSAGTRLAKKAGSWDPTILP